MKKTVKMIASLICAAALCLPVQTVAYAEKKIASEITYSDKYTTLTLTPVSEKNTIRYTTDGSEPDKSSPVYTERLKTKKAVTVKAAEFDKKGKKIASLKAELRRMCGEVTVSAEKTDKGYTVTLSSGTKNCDIFYTTDGTEPTKKSMKYEGAFTADENTEVRAFARKSGWKNSPVAVSVISDTPAVVLPEEEATVLELINQFREENGLSPLTPDAALCEAAEIRAEELLTRYEHIRPDGSDWFTVLKEISFPFAAAAENIAWGEGTKSDPATTFNDWINSPVHLANILSDNVDLTGIYSVCAGNKTYRVQLFGRRK